MTELFGTLVALEGLMIPDQKSRGLLFADTTTSSMVRVPCPGRAHMTGEECLICDEDEDGTISVVVTEVELGALTSAAQGRAFDRSFAPRLRALGLLQDLEGLTVPTPKGYALLGGMSRVSN